MRLIFLIFALLSAFFIPVFALEHPDYGTLIPAEESEQLTFTYSRDFCSSNPVVYIPDQPPTIALFDSLLPCMYSNFVSLTEVITHDFDFSYNVDGSISSFKATGDFRFLKSDGYTSQVSNRRFYFSRTTSSAYSCPDNLTLIEYQGSNWCYDPVYNPNTCGIGYHPKSVSHMLGDPNICHPRDCEPTGQQDSLYAVAGAGAEPFTSAGAYCHQGCAYSVSQEAIASPSSAYGVSTGSHCAAYNDPNKKIADLDDLNSCTSGTTPSGKPSLDCSSSSNSDNPNESDLPPDESVNNDDSKVDESSDVSMSELHNKMIDAQTKNTNKMVEAIRDNTAQQVEANRQDTYSHEQLIAKLDSLIAAQSGDNGSVGDGGGSGGDGGGTGDGDGDGDGEEVCTGTAFECTGISETQLSVENIDLSSYQSQYTGLLPSAELEQQKCITLTTGNQLCVDFSNIILLIQSLGYLLVLGSWIHSARILVRGLSS